MLPCMIASLPATGIDAVIFDIDNVLVDTRLSYLEAIRWTIDLYLMHGNVPFFQAKKKLSAPHFYHSPCGSNY